MRRYISCLSSVILVLFSWFAVEAQKIHLSENDKAQIVGTILKRWKFIDPEYDSGSSEKIVYFLADDVPLALLPKIKGVKFVSITEEEIDEQKKTGVEYYSFSEFEIKGRTVEISFSRIYSHFGDGYGAGNSANYLFRKISGRWRIKKIEPSVWVSESF